jgi:hypothetical protein
MSDFQVWDIGQVTVSNFDWLPFTPLWSPSPVLHPVYLIPSLPPAHLRGATNLILKVKIIAITLYFEGDYFPTTPS